MYKSIKKLIGIFLLTVLFSMTVLAGDTQCPQSAAPCGEAIEYSVDDPNALASNVVLQQDNSSFSTFENEEASMMQIAKIIMDSFRLYF